MLVLTFEGRLCRGKFRNTFWPVARWRYAHTVVMIRHGESTWNLENKFAGWQDVPLTKNGEADAFDAGRLIGQRKLKFDVAFTSKLERAWRTCAIALSASGQSGVKTIRSKRLNERHYGALQGHSKNCDKLMEIFGKEKMWQWRQSFHTTPPSMYDLAFHMQLGDAAADGLRINTDHMNESDIDMAVYLAAQLRLRELTQSCTAAGAVAAAAAAAAANTDSAVNLSVNYHNSPVPHTESLQQCQERAFGYWEKVIAPRVRAGEKVLIVAHANTIRALVKAMDGIDDHDIAHLKIPNGVPLVYTLDDDLKPRSEIVDEIGFQANFLVSARNHGKMMRYERNMQKKLRSLFEYLDVDNDGFITRDCLLSGLSRLQTFEVEQGELRSRQGDPTLGTSSPPTVPETAEPHPLSISRRQQPHHHHHQYHQQEQQRRQRSLKGGDDDDDSDDPDEDRVNRRRSNNMSSKGNDRNNKMGVEEEETPTQRRIASWSAYNLAQRSSEGAGEGWSEGAGEGWTEGEGGVEGGGGWGSAQQLYGEKAEHDEIDALARMGGSTAVYELESERSSVIHPDVYEFEVEEILRCVPDADENGGITLEAFLKSEKTLMNKLKNLKLLQ